MNTEFITKPASTIVGKVVEHKGKSITLASIVSLLAVWSEVSEFRRVVAHRSENNAQDISKSWQDYQDQRLEDMSELARLKVQVDYLLKKNLNAANINTATVAVTNQNE